MSADGYIYITNWDTIQGRRDRRDPWHKVYNELLRHDAYAALTLADRGTLHGLWMLASSTGDGRVSSSRTYLGRQLNVRRVSLEPLIHAGFIEIRAAKAPRVRGLEERREDNTPPTPPQIAPPALVPDETPEDKKNGEPTTTTWPYLELPFVMRERWIADSVLRTFVAADIPILAASWKASNDLRHSGAAIEKARDPRAYALSIANRSSRETA